MMDKAESDAFRQLSACHQNAVCDRQTGRAMTEIVVSHEQARIITEASAGVVVRDPDGNFLGYITLTFTVREIAAARIAAASEQPRYTTREVLDHLRSLQ
jgi:hypothetical protein